MASILIGGGTGLIGSRFVELYKDKHDFRILTRSPQQNTEHINYYKWDIYKKEIDLEAMDVDHIINLNGAGIAEARWTQRRKQVLIDSRVKSNETLLQGIKASGKQPQSIVSASAIGYYGDRGEEVLTEQSSLGQGFLAQCSKLWEDSADLLKHYTKSLTKVRIGVVLSSQGGALPKLLMTKGVGVFTYFGNGQHYYSWIHIDDLCRMLYKAMMDDGINDVINGVSPTPLTNKAFTQSIKEGLDQPGVVVPAPAFGIRLAMGEMADVVMNSNRVIPERLNQLSFEWQYTDPGVAAKDLLDRKV